MQFIQLTIYKISESLRVVFEEKYYGPLIYIAVVVAFN